jgi:hypothetical protein
VAILILGCDLGYIVAFRERVGVAQRIAYALVGFVLRVLVEHQRLG